MIQVDFRSNAGLTPATRLGSIRVRYMSSYVSFPGGGWDEGANFMAGQPTPPHVPPQINPLVGSSWRHSVFRMI